LTGFIDIHFPINYCTLSSRAGQDCVTRPSLSPFCNGHDFLASRLDEALSLAKQGVTIELEENVKV
jgi:hypothetical protein